MAPSTKLEYQPAIDGLRAVAVALVLLFHGGWALFSGGYVGVSLFFTISGFLITSLLVHEFESTTTISISDFYVRRLKRLLPASVLCVITVSLIARGGYFASIDGLRSDVSSAALQVFNWRALFRGQSYADLIGASQPSPLDHFWSLSVEEQFYWLWPIAMLLILRRTKRGSDLVGLRSKAVYFVTAVFILIAPIIAKVWGPNAAYWATPARLGEILVGASLAMWIGNSRYQNRIRSSGSVVGCIGLIVVLVSAMTWPAGSGPAYLGLFPIFALASAATIIGALSHGMFRKILAHRLLVELGKRSYGIYLIHWPVFVLINENDLSISHGAIFAIQIAITLIIAWLSYALIEKPIRYGKFSQRQTLGFAGLATGIVVVIALTVVPQPPLLFTNEVDAGEVSLRYEQTPNESTPSSEVENSDSNQPIKLVVLGDSTAVALSAGVVSWAQEDFSRARVSIVARTACGFARATSIEDNTGNFRRDCDQALGPQLTNALGLRPTQALLMVGLADSGPMIWNDDEGVLQPNSKRFADNINQDYRKLIDQLIASGVTRIHWLLAPHPTAWWLGNLGHSPGSLRTDLTNKWILAIANDYPDVIRVIRFDEWLLSRERVGDRSWRPDGLHLAEDSARRVMNDYLGQILLGQ